MAKKVMGQIKLQVPAGAANPSPPIGPALGQRGLNIMEFCKGFNARTQDMPKGDPCPVVITYYQDKSFTFEIKTPPASFLIKKAAKLPTEITEDTVREAAFPLGLVDVKVCAVDEKWSGLKLVIRRENRPR